MSRLIDADALIEFCAERWIPLNIDAVNMQPTIQPEKAQLSQEGTTSDLISRQAAIDALAKFVPYAICDESTESYTNGLTDAYNLILQLPSAQPDGEYISRQAVTESDLIDWYINSVDESEPVWTEEHIHELFYDFYLIPKED